jgi:hypothetical protein
MTEKAQDAVFASDRNAMTRRILALVCILASALVALPAVASAKKAKAKTPTVTLVSPMRLSVGDTIVIRGKNFNKVARRNTVVFKGPNGRSVLVKPIRATTKRLVVKVPASVAKLFATKAGDPTATRFKLQVLANKKRSATRTGTSPVIVPDGADKPAPAPPKKKATGTTPVTPAGPPPPCGSGSDWDGDLLSNTLEGTLLTDPCKKDSDGDGVTDGFEYKSAVDLNDDEFQNPNTSLPYPGKRPYPNPLDGADANQDFDGDSLTSTEEQKLWDYTVTLGATRTLDPLTYSAGEQYSVNTRGADGHRTPTLAAAGYAKQASFLSWANTNGYRNVMLSTGPPWFVWYDQAHQSSFGLLDTNRSGSESAGEASYYNFRPDSFLSDDERDEDADGLTNYAETHGPLSNAGWWTSCYASASEKAFPVVYAGTDFITPDTDGDGVLDGADDQDHDDIPNVMELSRLASSGFDDRKNGASCKLSGNFAVTGGPLPGSPVLVTFQGDNAGQNVPQMTADGGGLTGGSSPTVTVTTTRSGGGGVDEQQRVSISGAPTGGDFTLTVLGHTTDPIAFNAKAAEVQAALEAALPIDLSARSATYGRINPFNPCLPNPLSRTCPDHIEFGNDYAPFDDSPDWYALN